MSEVIYLNDWPYQTLFILGWDIAKLSDYSALAIVKTSGDPIPLKHAEPDPTQRPPRHYAVVHLDRWRGMNYPEQVDRIKDYLNRPELASWSQLVMDQSGVGEAVRDSVKALKIPSLGITIKGGLGVKREDDGHVSVGRVELLQLVQKVFVQERIEIAQDLALRPMLRQELLNLQETIREATRRLAIDQADERIHDDLAMSLALTIWAGEHPPPVVRTQRLLGF